MDSETPSRRGSDAHALVRWLDGASWFAHAVSGFIVVAIVLMTVLDVIGRKYLDSPFPGAIELTEVGLVVAVYLGLAHAQRRGDHVEIDFVYDLAGPRLQKVMYLTSRLISVVVAGMLTWRLFVYARLLDAGNYITATWKLPLAHTAIVAVVGAALFLVALVASISLAPPRDREDSQ